MTLTEWVKIGIFDKEYEIMYCITQRVLLYNLTNCSL